MDYQETEYMRDFFTILKIYVWTFIISHIINIYSHTMHSYCKNQLTNKSLNSDFVWSYFFKLSTQLLVINHKHVLSDVSPSGIAKTSDTF